VRSLAVLAAALPASPIRDERSNDERSNDERSNDERSDDTAQHHRLTGRD
jgi:hypothetical protein